MQKREPQERNLCAPKLLEEGTHQETLQQGRCARREARDLAKKLKKMESYVALPNRSLGKKPEEREFVVDSRASKHMLSKKKRLELS